VWVHVHKCFIALNNVFEILKTEVAAHLSVRIRITTITFCGRCGYDVSESCKVTNTELLHSVSLNLRQLEIMKCGFSFINLINVSGECGL
jgi:hypothetical protein